MTVLAGAAQSVESKDRALAGTYDLLICKGSPCSFAERANVVRSGVIVFLDRAMKGKDVARMDPAYDFRREKANACFVLTYPIPQVHGATAWSLDGKTLSFILMRSKDSWYSVRVDRRGDMLSGVGNIWSAGVAPPPGFVTDTVVGRWRGTADISACEARARVERSE
jgi:hypothetical protein